MQALQRLLLLESSTSTVFTPLLPHFWLPQLVMGLLLPLASTPPLVPPSPPLKLLPWQQTSVRILVHLVLLLELPPLRLLVVRPLLLTLVSLRHPLWPHPRSMASSWVGLAAPVLGQHRPHWLAHWHRYLWSCQHPCQLVHWRHLDSILQLRCSLFGTGGASGRPRYQDACLHHQSWGELILVSLKWLEVTDQLFRQTGGLFSCGSLPSYVWLPRVVGIPIWTCLYWGQTLGQRSSWQSFGSPSQSFQAQPFSD